MARWRGGAVARWRSSAVAQWRSGAVAQWRSGAVAQWRSGAVARASYFWLNEPSFKSCAAAQNVATCCSSSSNPMTETVMDICLRIVFAH